MILLAKLLNKRIHLCPCSIYLGKIVDPKWAQAHNVSLKVHSSFSANAPQFPLSITPKKSLQAPVGPTAARALMLQRVNLLLTLNLLKEVDSSCPVCPPCPPPPPQSALSVPANAHRSSVHSFVFLLDFLKRSHRRDTDL